MDSVAAVSDWARCLRVPTESKMGQVVKNKNVQNVQSVQSKKISAIGILVFMAKGTSGKIKPPADGGMGQFGAYKLQKEGWPPARWLGSSTRP